MNDMQNYRARIGLLLTLAYGSACALNAQGSSIAPTPPPAASSSPAADKDSDSITVLDKVTVSDVPIDQQVLPTVRPISSVLGDDTAIIDIPRSVSSVNKASPALTYSPDFLCQTETTPLVIDSPTAGIFTSTLMSS